MITEILGISQKTYSFEELLSEFSKNAYASVKSDPAKAWYEAFGSEDAIDHLRMYASPTLRKVAARPSRNSQKNYMISAVLSEHELLNFWQYVHSEADDSVAGVFMAHESHSNASTAKLCNALNTDKAIGAWRANKLLDFVKSVIVVACYQLTFERLYKRRLPNEALQKYDLMSKAHAKKLCIEMFMRGIEECGTVEQKRQFSELIGAYDFTFAEKRRAILESYRRSVELGNFDNLNAVASKFADLLRSQSARVEHFEHLLGSRA